MADPKKEPVMKFLISLFVTLTGLCALADSNRMPCESTEYSEAYSSLYHLKPVSGAEYQPELVSLLTYPHAGVQCLNVSGAEPPNEAFERDVTYEFSSRSAQFTLRIVRSIAKPDEDGF